MGACLHHIDAAPPDLRWAMVRGWLLGELLPFFAVLRAERLVLALSEVTLAARYHVCAMILRRHNDFGVDLPNPEHVVSERKRANIHLALLVARLVAKRTVQEKLAAANARNRAEVPAPRRAGRGRFPKFEGGVPEHYRLTWRN